MKADYRPNQIFNVKRNAKQSILGMNLVKVAQNETGLEVAFNLMPESNNRAMIPIEGIIRVITEAEQKSCASEGMKG